MDINKTSITRRLEASLDGLQEEFRALYTAEDLSRAADELRRSAGRSDHSSKLKRLFGMLELCGISYERGLSDSAYEEIIRAADIPSFAGSEERILRALYTVFERYPAPDEYMERLVNRLSSPDDNWFLDTLRLRILKQFIKYGNYLYDAKCGSRAYIRSYAAERGASGKSVEEVISHLDDHVFDPLFAAETTKDQRKFDGKYGLLKIADDLASGKFRVWGVTKQDLYLFAMVYGMTYNSGADDGDAAFDRRTDIEINLFRDYYTNNFVRFITGTYRGKLQEFELDPSGQGINYKNFAEMVYLYYISSDLSPEEKISRSHAMIQDIRSAMVGKGAPAEWTGSDSTETFRRMIRDPDRARMSSEDILNRPEDEFRDFLCRYYFCDTSGSYIPQEGAKSKVSPLMLETGQYTAYENYRMIIDGLADLGLEPEDCDYGLWFTDVQALYRKGFDGLSETRPGVSEKSFADFMDLLAGVDKYMKGALRIESPENVTRSSMITAFYYYYNALRAGDGTTRGMSFEDVFNDFKTEADAYLEESGYQLFSGRDLFDVLVAFSAYSYIYM
ncbi:MAG: hypothetical protein E7230_04380 [Clostridiales bacterium]|nr:hypothetical protein [Clostridiales bacterium]